MVPLNFLVPVMTTFLLRLVDQMLSTYKTLLMTKQRKFAAALANAFAAGSYLLIIKQMQRNDNGWMDLVAVCAATFVGSYLPMFLMDKYEKDRVFIFEVTPVSNDAGKQFADALRESELKVMTYKGYNAEKELVLCVRAYTRSRAESRLVETLIPADFKWTMVETRTTA